MSDFLSTPASIGQRLRQAREQAGLSQGQVARMLEYHRPTISQIEAGNRIVRPDEIRRFAEIYCVKEEWILAGDSHLEGNADPRIELAARELKKLKQEDLNAILDMIKVMRTIGDSGE